jgi:ankyrin repeat protein
MDTSGRQHHADTSATDHYLLSIVEFGDFFNSLQEPTLASLHRAILHGISALKLLPSGHPEGPARAKRFQDRLYRSFGLLHPPTAISQAASWGFTEIVELLLISNMVDVNLRVDASDRTPLHLATENGHDGAVQVLMRQGADINAKDRDGRAALHFAAEQGHKAILRLLLENGADVHAKMISMDEGVCYGATALHCAAWQGHEVIAQALLQAGADVDEQDRWDARTALHMAAQEGHEAVVRLLVENKAAVDGSLNDHQATPLILAATNGHEAVVRLLLSKGANINRTDSDGDPALHSAAFSGHETVVRLLLDHGADPTARGSGRTARWFAAEKGHHAVVQLLLERGGNDKDGPDMQNDAYEGLINVFDGRLLGDIERAQQIIFHESEIQHWVENLRFVVPAVNGDDSYHDLELIENGAGDKETKDEPYIAISYCWGKRTSKEGTPLRIQVPSKDQCGAKEIRNVRAPSNILRRSLAFAAAKGIKRIWIDQECIHQDDEEDRRVAIQCMHLVYRQAATTLIVLDDHVQTLEDVRAIPHIKEHGVDQELRDRILGDRWFSRAWTTQEHVNSERERLTYLIGWKDGVDVSGDAWQLEAAASNARQKPPQWDGSRAWKPYPQQNVRRSWELSEDNILAISFMNSRHGYVMESLVASLQFAGSAGKERVFRLLDPDIEAGEMQGVSGSPAAYQKLRMTMPEAYLALRRKNCLLNSDRLAILSNLAFFPYRIRTDQVVRERLSFTACVIAIALCNGDLSLLFCQSPYSSVSIPVSHPASWLPLGMCSIDRLITMMGMPTHTYMGSHIPTGDRCLVLDGKAIIKGLLWDIVPFQDFNILRDRVRELRQSGEKGASQLLLRPLVNRCLALGRRDVLELIITTALPRQFRSPAEIYVLMDELDASFHGRRSWPTDFDEEPNLLANNSLPASRSENALIRSIYESICNGLPLALGQCNIGGEEDKETLISIFTFNPTEQCNIFTPLSELEYEFGDSAFLHHFPKRSFWFVNDCKTEVADTTMQRARMKLNTERDDSLFLSNQIFEIDRSWDTRNILGIWSPRLSRIGMHVQDLETKSWRRVPLGKGMC